MATSGVEEQDKYRTYLYGEEKDTKWRFGAPPNYDVVNKLFEEGRTKVLLWSLPLSLSLLSVWVWENINIIVWQSDKHLIVSWKIWPPGSLEEKVQNLIKTWEMEMFHKTSFDDYKSVDPKKYTFSLNGNYEAPGFLQCCPFYLCFINSINSIIQILPFWYSIRITLIITCRKEGYNFRGKAQAWGRLQFLVANLLAREASWLQPSRRNSWLISQGFHHSFPTWVCSGDCTSLFRATSDCVQVQALGFLGRSFQRPRTNRRTGWTLWDGCFWGIAFEVLYPHHCRRRRRHNHLLLMVFLLF